MQPVTEVPEPPLPDGVASPPPVGFVVVLWIGAFSAMLWGMFVVFGRPLGQAPAPPRPRSDPDPTLDEPGPHS